MFYSFKGLRPIVDPSAFVHPEANVTGDVWIGPDVYIGPGAVLRGDWGRITVHAGANIQENCVVHVFPGEDVVLHEAAHIGHGAIVHGATVGKNCLIGMHAVLMDQSVVGDESIVGALCFVPQGMDIPPRSVVVGNPAKIVKQVSDEQLAWKTEGTGWYQRLPGEAREELVPCEPLQKPEENREKIKFSTTYSPRSR